VLNPKALQIAQDLAVIKDAIQGKVGKVNDKIGSYSEKIQEIKRNEEGHSEGWVNKQVNKYQSKIDKLSAEVETWSQQQMNTAQEWADKQTAEANERASSIENSMASAVQDSIPPVVPDEGESEESTEQTNDDLLYSNASDYDDTNKFVRKAQEYTYFNNGRSGIEEIEKYISNLRERLNKNQYANSDYRDSDEEFIQLLNNILDRLNEEKVICENRIKIDNEMTKFIDDAYNDEKTLEELTTALNIVNSRLEEDNYLISEWKTNDLSYKDDLEYLIANMSNESDANE
jgi:hypothetical protein